ncbi:MAG: dipeptidase [Lachnospiraceae bacterium]|nr:dipeptidase [Lachnospiraceae bacterium]
MKAIDMHCDTVKALYHNGKSFVENDMHIDLQRLKKGNYMAQCFAMYINQVKDGPDCKAACDNYIAFFKKLMDENRGVIRQAYTADEIEDNYAKGYLSAVLTIEGGEAIAGSLENLQHFYDLGVRMMTLTWNFENEIAYPNYITGESMTPDTEHGLKPFGKTCVKKMQELGMIVDVSHLSDSGIYDVLDIAEKPIAASHSNARAVCNVPRNMTDDMIRRLRENGGIMGLNYCPFFISEDAEHDQIPDIVKHALHIADVGGIETLALGSDFDGIPTPVGMDDCTKTNELYNALRAAGFSESDLDKVFWQNFLRVLRENEA